MMYEHRRKVVIGAVVFLTVIVCVFIYREFQRSVPVESIDVSTTLDRSAGVSIDFNDVGSDLSADQQRDIREVIGQKLQLTNNERVSGSIRENSVENGDGSIRFIVNVSQKRTSFLVDRTRGEDFDIVNVFCVPQDEKIYESDGCREE